MEDVSLKIKNTTVIISLGDLLERQVDAVAVPDEDKQEMGLGIAKVVSEKAGSVGNNENKQTNAISPGEVAVSPGGLLYSKYIFNVVILEKGDKSPKRETIQLAVKSCLLKAEELKIKSIAFSPFGLNKAKVPYDMCARIMMEETIRYLLKNATPLEKIIFNLFNEEGFSSYKKVLIILKEEYFIV